MSLEQLPHGQMPEFHEEECEHAFYQAKWPTGFRCPRCGCSAYYRISSRGRRLFECRSCAHQTSLTAGTILEGTRTPLVKWFQALFLMQIGISAKLLAERILVTYKTAWLINHKLRHAIQVLDEASPLAGDLQVYGNFYAGPTTSWPSDPLAPQEQPVIVGASSDPDTGELTAVKIKRMPAAGFARRVFDLESIGGFVWRHAADAKSRTRNIEVVKVNDGFGVTELGGIWRGVIRWLARTFGGIGPKHLQAYLDEYCFRLNVRADAQETLLSLCGSTNTITQPELVGKDRHVRPIRWTGIAGRRKPRLRGAEVC
ncbi:IS1595 family transposase [Cohnella sp. 56]|uniref:IS1595 family transposase n=1 Tax=Cohnella sp. 56 TaxID=3113722 RepID=UPI0030EB0875